MNPKVPRLVFLRSLKTLRKGSVLPAIAAAYWVSKLSGGKVSFVQTVLIVTLGIGLMYVVAGGLFLLVFYAVEAANGGDAWIERSEREVGASTTKPAQ